MGLYRADGPRRIAPPLVFGAGVLWHLLRHGSKYDVVHTASFPYFSLLAAAVARRVHGFHLVVDWHELWSRAYWHEYLGAIGGRIGRAVQAACLRVPQRAFCFAHMTGERLRSEGVRGTVTVLEGEYAGSLSPRPPLPAEPLVVFAGRHIPEKRAAAVVPAVAKARERVPGLKARILGDGPQRSDGARRHRPPRGRGLRRGAGVRDDGAGRARSRPCAVPGAAVAPRGLRAGRRRGVVVRHAERARARSRQRGDRPDRRGRQRLRGAPTRAPSGSRTRSSACTRRAPRCARRRRTGSPPTRAGCRSTARSTRSPRATPPRARSSRASAPPCAPR